MSSKTTTRVKRGPPAGGRRPKPPELQRRSLGAWLSDQEMFDLHVLALRRKVSVSDLVSEQLRQLIRQEKTKA